MSTRPAIAFYAPLKAPDHPVPSGDRLMGRLLFDALAQAGFAPEIASSLRTHDKIGDPQKQRASRKEAELETLRLIAQFRAAPAEKRPRLWFTYHVYYKAPDWIGPAVARALEIPYVVAEGSRAPKRAAGAWALAHAATEAALDEARVIFVINEADRAILEEARPPYQKLVSLPPFIESDAEPPISKRASNVARLLTVAMMRSGDKLRSYRILAEALRLIEDRPWSLTIVGDGESRPQIAKAFAPFGSRIDFRGLVEERECLMRLYDEADIFVWPAVNEAYGMAPLEAQSRGCPVVAGQSGGIDQIVRDGVTGLLVEAGNAAALAKAVSGLLEDPSRRREMGEAARRFVCEEHSVEHAALILREHLAPLLVTRIGA